MILRSLGSLFETCRRIKQLLILFKSCSDFGRRLRAGTSPFLGRPGLGVAIVKVTVVLALGEANMKLQLFIVTMTLMSGAYARAEGKEPLHVDFNQLIDQGLNDDAGLNKDLSGHYDAQAHAAEAPAPEDAADVADDSQRVHDFVTFEVIQKKKDSVAAEEEKPVVKRVYNSVEEPRVATLPEVELVPVKSRANN